MTWRAGWTDYVVRGLSRHLPGFEVRAEVIDHGGWLAVALLLDGTPITGFRFSFDGLWRRPPGDKAFRRLARRVRHKVATR